MAEQPSVRLNSMGFGQPSLFTVHPQDPNYSYLIANIAAGQHRIESDSGFNAIAYGFGSAESYGYNAGTNIRDLYNFLVTTEPAQPRTGSGCLYRNPDFPECYLPLSTNIPVLGFSWFSNA